jgi:hypothetical protein
MSTARHQGEEKHAPNAPASSIDLRQRALSRWDNEGGAPAGALTENSGNGRVAEYPPLTNAELVHLRIRVIALENLVIALLNQATSHQLDTARETAAYISPRPNYTQHPLTLKAAEHRTDLLDRAARYQPDV